MARYRELVQLAPGTTHCRFNLLWDCSASFHQASGSELVDASSCSQRPPRRGHSQTGVHVLGSVADWTDSYSEDSSVLPDQSLTSSEIRLPCEHVGPGKRLTALFGGSFVGKKEAI